MDQVVNVRAGNTFVSKHPFAIKRKRERRDEDAIWINQITLFVGTYHYFFRQASRAFDLAKMHPNAPRDEGNSAQCSAQ